MTVLDSPALGAASEAIAIKTESMNDTALNINAVLNKMTTTIAGVWNLALTSVEVPQATFISYKNPTSESVLDGDDRVLVAAKDFQPGGKYRSIVKLFIKFSNLPNTKFAHGTGWLIRPDLLITAGHNVFDWKANAGRAIEIKAYVGYNGRESIGDPSVEFRRGSRVVTTSQWLSNRGSMAHDIAFVQLDKPFTDITPFQYIETPPRDKQILGVVGYPADKLDGSTGEKGGKMYELFQETSYNIMEQRDTMLQHYIDSEGGNSGGPILRGSDLVAIATHVYGGDFNTASVLGRYGNPVQDYLAAFDLPLASPGKINLVPVGSSYINQGDAATGPQVLEIAKLGDNVIDSGASKTEFSVFDGIADVVKTVGQVSVALGPFAGPVGNVVTSIISTTLIAAEPGSMTALPRTLLANAILVAAEAKRNTEEGFFDTITEIAIKATQVGIGKSIRLTTELQAQTVDLISAQIMHGLLLRAETLPASVDTKQESALDAAVKSSTADLNDKEVAFIQKLLQHLSPSSAQRFAKEWETQKPTGKISIGKVEDPAARFLMQGLDPAVAQRSAINQEGFFDTIGDEAIEAGKFVRGTFKEVYKMTEGNVKQVVALGDYLIDRSMDAATDAERSASPVTKDLVKKFDDVTGGVIDKSYWRWRMKRAKGTIALTNDVTTRPSENTFDNQSSDNADVSTSTDTANPTDSELQASVGKEVRRYAEALVLHTLIADAYLTAKTAQPISALEAEGFFDDVGDFFSNSDNLHIVSGALNIAGTVAVFAPGVGTVTGLGLMAAGAGIDAAGFALKKPGR